VTLLTIALLGLLFLLVLRPHGTVQAVEELMAWFSSFAMKSDLASYCHLEIGLDDTTLVTHGGSMMSVLDLAGCRNIVGKPEFDEIRARLTGALAVSLGRPGHSIEIVFERDSERTRAGIEASLRPSRETATRIGLEHWNLLLDDYADKLEQYCAAESALVVIYTHPTLIPPEQFKTEMKDRADRARTAKLPRMGDSQSPLSIIDALTHQHQTIVERISDDLSKAGLHAELLDVHTAMRRIRQAVDRGWTSDQWRAVLPGDKIPLRAVPRTADYADLFLPKLSLQLVPRRAVVEGDMVKIGDCYTATMIMEVGPQDTQSFMAVFRRLHADIPWRMSINITPAGLDQVRFKKLMCSIFGFMPGNKPIQESFLALTALQRADTCLVAIRVNFATWGKDPAVVRKNLTAVAKAVQGWGGTDTTDDAGDPLAGFASSLPGFTDTNIAPPLVMPLFDAVSMLPVQRPASPWQEGPLIFGSPDGKLFPYEPGSAKQDAWADLIVASMGSGKSVLLNILNRATCLRPGLTQLPLITIIDVAPSSRALINLLHASLPPGRQHEAAYYRLRMDAKYAVNPFDTQLGCRFPNQMERAHQIGILSMLATPVGSTKPYESASDLAGLLIDEAYRVFSEDQPRRFERTVEVDVDAALDRIGYKADGVATWWEVEDALFAAGEMHAATLAHRHAVPTLVDMMGMIQSDVIRDTFARNENSAVRISTGELLIDAMSRVISAALREYPVLATSTRFDLGLARVVSFDLDEVARGGSEAGKKQAAIMYMMARHMAARNYYLDRDMIRSGRCPAQYLAYHDERVDEIRGNLKTIRYDEFHRTGRMEALRDLIALDIREGRKWNIQITLVSQLLGDFTPDMVTLATGVYILKADSAAMVEEARQMFGLSDTAVERLKSDAHGPGKRGANFLVRYKTKAGEIIQILTNLIGGMEIWATSTTPEDMGLCNQLADLVGSPQRAWEILAKAYPDGTAKGEVERRRKLLNADDDADVIAAMARELAERAVRKAA
jgi:intracellular multiplication protein IcmB